MSSYITSLPRKTKPKRASMSTIRPLAIAFITIFGLNTPKDSECYGLRSFMIEQAQSFPGSKAFFYEFDQSNLITQILTDSTDFDMVVLTGHSFGGAAAKHLLDWVSIKGPDEKRLVASLAIFCDPAPNPVRFDQFFSWQAADNDVYDRWHIPLSVTAQTICIYQRNQQIIPGVIGVCGVPFVPVPINTDYRCAAGSDAELATSIVRNYDVSGWGVNHCDMLGNARVQALMAGAILQRYQQVSNA